jgi:hypothetical protein
MSGLKHAEVSLSAEARRKLEREKQNKANRRAALRLNRKVQEEIERLNVPFVRVRCASELKAMQQKAKEVALLCEQGEFARVTEQAAAVQASVDAIETACWSAPANARKRNMPKDGPAARLTATRVCAQLAAIRNDEVVQKWLQEEAARTERRGRSLVRSLAATRTPRGDHDAQYARDADEIEAEVNRLIAGAELLEAQDMERMRMAEGFRGALQELGYSLDPFYYERPGDVRSRVRMRAYRPDGAEIVLSFGLEENRVETLAGGFFDRACLAECQLLAGNLAKAGIQAKFITPENPADQHDSEAADPHAMLAPHELSRG